MGAFSRATPSPTAAQYLYLFALFPVAILSGGYQLVLSWNWFAVPLGMPAITFAHACGLSLLVGVFKEVKKNEEDERDLSVILWSTTIQIATRFAVCVGLGWAIHSWWMR